MGTERVAAVAIASLAIAGLASIARAEEPALAPVPAPALAPVPAPALAPVPAPPPEHYGPVRAFALSAVATTVTWGGFAIAALSYSRPGMAVAVGAATIAPSAGHVYARDYPTVGLGIRGAGLAFAGIGFAQGIRPFCGECHDGSGWLTLGILVFAGGTLYDVATAPKAARDANRERARSLTIAPQLAPGHTGVAVMGTF